MSEKIAIYEERPATVRAFRCEKERYIGNSYGVTLAKIGDYIVIDSFSGVRCFSPKEFLSRYKAQEFFLPGELEDPMCLMPDPVYVLVVDQKGQILNIKETQPTPV